MTHVDALFAAERAAWRSLVASSLPCLVDTWMLELDEVLPGGYNSLVLACRADGRQAVLKLSLDRDGIVAEARALRHWGPDAAVAVLDVSADASALLLERLVPGALADGVTEATGDAGQLLSGLHAAKPAPEDFRTLAEQYADVSERLAGMWALSPDILRREQVDRAAAQFRDLTAAPVPGGLVLLHGDPVPANFLLGSRGHRAIDPRPVVGDPAFDAAFWALFAESGDDVIAKAEALASALELDGSRVLRWARAIATDRTLQVARSPLHQSLRARLAAFLAASAAW